MGSKSESAPAPITPEQTAAATMQAQINSVLPLQQAQMTAYQDPNSGLLAQNTLLNSIRQQLYPEQYGTQQQYIQNILRQLQSPQGITAEQQAAVNTRRGQAQTDLIKAIRERANLGGKLYGGYAFDREAKGISDLQNQFSEQDIGRDFQNRQAAYQNALPILQMFLGQQLAMPNVQYQNAAPSGDTSYSGAVNQRGQDMTYAAQQQASQNALYQAMFKGLGAVAAAAAAPVTGGASLALLPALTGAAGENRTL